MSVTTTSKVNDFINRFKTARLLHAEEAEDSSEEGPDVFMFEYEGDSAASRCW